MVNSRNNKNFPMPGPQQCHPRVGDVRPEWGCLPVETLKKVAKMYGINSEKNPSTLRSDIEKHVKMEEGVHEYSFLMKLRLSREEKDSLFRQYLRPMYPNAWKWDNDKWLDSNDIERVMKQYEEAFPNFDFMGPFPIDFAAPKPNTPPGTAPKCLMDEICEYRVQSAAKNKKDMLGVIYNLDPHYKSGSHWVATFVDLKKNRCMYFDSYGLKPPKQILTFMSWVSNQDAARKMPLMYSSRRVQYKNTECGVYCLYFIIRMLMGDEFVTFTRATPNDAGMLELRTWIFAD
jgi:hypothetical protein|uniref:Ubiquitin-like protease family profile domain-containing protein n=1 Tax=viral metagenome TaxID=1070528 RepID=A0A6C0K7P2_9ZZZZ